MSAFQFWLLTNSIWSCLLLAWTVNAAFAPGGAVDRMKMTWLTRRDMPPPGEHLHVTRYPFSIYVADNFSRDKYFTMLYDDTPGIYLSVNPGYTDDTKHFLVGIGEHFAFSCDYSVVDQQAVVHSLSLNRCQGEWLTDMNADGLFDMRNYYPEQEYLDPEQAPGVYVWFNHSWEAIMDAIADPQQDLYHKRLVTGEYVEFDHGQGRWVLRDGPPVRP
jgi:hypothetical protein